MTFSGLTASLTPATDAWVGAQFHGTVVNTTNHTIVVNGLPSASAYGTQGVSRGTQEDLIGSSVGATLQPGQSTSFAGANSFLDVWGDPVTWTFDTTNVYASWAFPLPAGCPLQAPAAH